ncbi:SpoIIE family protein phosphatase [Streptomyces zingiberis]|uniref:SpoIIE family protein phosphatase n=1 Tax=Streptomyces zingiberis TaxID=2053010 RepID=A0ABX1BWH8_9ACTN|nr:SpoIIE family protein phosphatase [Streptomyces zingiberis]NJQ01448.1 SpoIIE family protein phosphatase [Streptomyces zingiberis]
MAAEPHLVPASAGTNGTGGTDGRDGTEVNGTADPAGTVMRLLNRTSASGLLTAAKEAALTTLGARAGAVYIRQDDGRLRLATTTGYGEYIVERYGSLDPGADLPAAEAARARRLVWRPAHEYTGLGGDATRFPAPRAFASLPLMADDRCLAVVTAELDGDRPLSPDEERTLTLIAAVAGQRLEHLLSREVRALPAGVPRLDQAVRLVEGRARAARLELALASADIGAFDWDFASGRLVWDERTCRLFGVDAETWDERIDTFYELVHPEDRAAVRTAARAALRTGHYAAVHRVVHPGAGVRWIDAKARVVTDPAGRPQGLVGVVQDRTEEREREEGRLARREFVLNVTGAFGSALSTQDVVDTMTGTVLPALEAVALAVHLVEDGDVVLAGAAGYPPDVLRRLDSAAMAEPGSPLSAALRAGGPLFLESRAEHRAAFPDERYLPAGGHHAWALLPLATADGTVGTCVLSYDRPRTFTAEDEVLATAVASILAQSLARARLFDRRRTDMTALQRVMLPRTLPEVPGLEIAVRYLPGSEGLDVGGDWYDVARLPGGRVGLTIGDVQGHSAEAAAVMGQIRTALLAYTDDGHGPAELMARGDRMLRGLDTDLFATACVVELDPATGALRIARAGHPYPLLLTADGTVRELECAGGLPLGCGQEGPYPVSAGELPPGGTLLLYTDGLVEGAGHDFDAGVARVKGSLGAWAAERVAGGEQTSGADGAEGADSSGGAGGADGSGTPAGPGTAGVAAGTGGVAPPDPGGAVRTATETLADRVTACAAAGTAADDIAVLLVHRPG